MKKILSLIIIYVLVLVNYVYAIEPTYQNRLLNIEFNKLPDGSVNTVLTFARPFTEPLKTTFKNTNEYAIILPETFSANPSISIHNTNEIKFTDTKLIPYFNTPENNGYTKVIIKTQKPLVFDVRSRISLNPPNELYPTQIAEKTKVKASEDFTFEPYTIPFKLTYSADSKKVISPTKTKTYVKKNYPKKVTKKSYRTIAKNYIKSKKFVSGKTKVAMRKSNVKAYRKPVVRTQVAKPITKVSIAPQKPIQQTQPSQQKSSENTDDIVKSIELANSEIKQDVVAEKTIENNNLDEAATYEFVDEGISGEKSNVLMSFINNFNINKYIPLVGIALIVLLGIFYIRRLNKKANKHFDKKVKETVKLKNEDISNMEVENQTIQEQQIVQTTPVQQGQKYIENEKEESQEIYDEISTSDLPQIQEAQEEQFELPDKMKKLSWQEKYKALKEKEKEKAKELLDKVPLPTIQRTKKEETSNVSGLLKDMNLLENNENDAAPKEVEVGVSNILKDMDLLDERKNEVEAYQAEDLEVQVTKNKKDLRKEVRNILDGNMDMENTTTEPKKEYSSGITDLLKDMDLLNHEEDYANTRKSYQNIPAYSSPVLLPEENENTSNVATVEKVVTIKENTDLDSQNAPTFMNLSNLRLLKEAKISNNKGFYLVKYLGKTALIGYIGDKIFVLTRFANNLYDNLDINFQLISRNKMFDIYHLSIEDYSASIKVMPNDMKIISELD